MKKLFTLLCCTLFAAQFSLVSAQDATTNTIVKIRICKDGEVINTFQTTSDIDVAVFEDEYEDLGNGVYKINGHEFVDLGLTSGVLWAKTNIGATTETGDGDYFAWGETNSKSTTTGYSQSDYKYGSTATAYTKYNATDQKTVLDLSDDAANAKWGSSCRMPTYDEIKELADNCTWKYETKTVDGVEVNGWTVTSKASGNTNSIFLPATGYCENGKLDKSGNSRYWSSSLYTNDTDSYGSGAWYLNYSNTGKTESQAHRFAGSTVRAVATKPVTE